MVRADGREDKSPWWLISYCDYVNSVANWLSYWRSCGDVLSYFWQYYAAGELSGSHSLIFVENAEEMLLPWKNNPNFVPIVLTHVITFVIGLAGNIVVISTMSRGHGERSVTRSVRLGMSCRLVFCNSTLTLYAISHAYMCCLCRSLLPCHIWKIWKQVVARDGQMSAGRTSLSQGQYG